MGFHRRCQYSDDVKASDKLEAGLRGALPTHNQPSGYYRELSHADDEERSLDNDEERSL